ncbi:conserved hypothetical protein [Culex quinquefasciatus]|uniref:Uncharacterized protein n=1 Tax=Culex quinquefasciatus TaxID=7176 RepID=B0WY09_CULQU|nr:conserved hypothetical protein [Culex quinquefasciatus]|eukprot:XP_001862281.1 conserved hypothetical protein [Culex quinquefasciatus]
MSDKHHQRLQLFLVDDTVNEDDADVNATDNDDDDQLLLPYELNDDAYAQIMAAILASSRRAAEVNRCNALNTVNTNKTLDCKFDRLISEVSGLRDAIEEKIDSINRKIKQTNKLFQASQDYDKRSGKACELVLMGIPYRRGENLREYFVRLCRVLGFQEFEIPLAYVRRMLSGSSSGSTARLKIPHYSHSILDNLKIRTNVKLTVQSRHSTPNESIIVVQFVFRNARNEFYRRYLDHKALCLRDIGLESGSRIFVNENLTRTNLGLKAEAMKMKRDGKLKNVFTVNGQIYVKRTSEHRPELVTSTVDLLLMDENKMRSNK